MSSHRFLVCLLVAVILCGSSVYVSVFADEGIERKASESKKEQDEQPDQPQEQQEDQAQQDQEEQRRSGMSTMDLLREKITGLASTGVSIVASGSTETSGQWITIKENAEIRIGLNKSLLADTILYNPSENLLRAEGNVVLLENKLRIGGDSLELNLNTNTGEVMNPYIESEEGFYIAGTRLEKEGPDTYTLHGAGLTSCNQPTPQWRMKASSITLKAGDTATLRNLRLNMLDTIPVFYAPWMQVPLDNKRGSGFLLPEWGSSDFHGFWAGTRYFWAFNDSHDATLGLDYYSKRGNRYSMEYRNNLGDGNTTYAHWYYIQDKSFYGENSDEKRDRYDAKVVNRSQLPLNFRFIANLEFLGDDTYRRDFINRDIYYNPLFRKVLSLSNEFEGYSFYIGYNELNRFRSRNRIRQIQYLPKIDFMAREKQLFGSPIYYSFDFGFVRPHLKDVFRRAEFGEDDEIDDQAYNRIDTQGQIKVPIKTFAPWLTVTPRVVGRNTYYSKIYNKKRTNIKDLEITRRYYDFGVDVIGPVFSKIYGNPASSSFLLKHVVEPRLSYLYRSDTGLSDKKEERIIVIDQEDTFFRVHEMRWTLNNIFYYKRNYPDGSQQGRVLEVLRVGVSQYVSMEDNLLTTYDKRYVFNPEEAEFTSRYSPLEIDATARFGNYARASARIEYDHQDNQFINYTLGGGVTIGGLRYNVGWYRSVGVVRFDRVGITRSKANRFVTNGSLALFDGMIRVRGAWDYDFQRERVLNYLAGIDIHGQCLGASAEIRKVNILGQNDLQTRFSIVLGNLGSILSGEQR